jgi:hypothetical protein
MEKKISESNLLMNNDSLNDIYYQENFVITNAYRLISLQDQDKASPTYGCFDYKFWRDKTSEFPDARFQEAGATLLLIARNKSIGLIGLNARQLEDSFSAGLKFLHSIQYPNGSFDEWYKGERGFAATEFVTIAYGLAKLYGEDLSKTDDQRLVDLLKKSCDWLIPRDDFTKSNHEAAAAAALAIGWKVTGIDSYLVAAKQKINHTFRRQTTEGWFPEIGGMDLGYCSVLLDYVMLYTHITGDQSTIPHMSKLIRFMHPLLNPNLTIYPELGLCLNPYVSRLGIGLLSQYDEYAKDLIFKIQKDSPGWLGLTPTLSDDLRFCRWSYLPLISKELEYLFIKQHQSIFTRDKASSKWRFFDQSAIALFESDSVKVIYAICGGGSIFGYAKDKEIFCYKGALLNIKNDTWASRGYSIDRPTIITENSVQTILSLSSIKGFNPGIISRLLLRLACQTAYGSGLARALIDHIRIKKKSAINQSSTPQESNRNSLPLTRTITIEKDIVEIKDAIQIPNNLNHYLIELEFGDHGNRYIQKPSSNNFTIKIIIDLKTGDKNITVIEEVR